MSRMLVLPVTAFAAVLVAASALLATTTIPCGGSVKFAVNQPRLDEEDGIPEGATYTGGGTGGPSVFEHDSTSSDDRMGRGTTRNAAADGKGGGVSEICITNTDGNLEGPNGVVQNGGGEGDCIEVMMCWRYSYVHPGANFEIGVSSGSAPGPKTALQEKSPNIRRTRRRLG